MTSPSPLQPDAPPQQPAAQLISVVLPIHNQADHLRAVVEDLVPALDRLPVPHELLLIVNGSSDQSIDLARELERTYSSVRAIESTLGGWGRAVRLGLAEARGDLVCYTNCARTSAEDLTLVLIYAMAYRGIVIKVNRRVRERLYRRLGSLLFNLECRVLFELSCWDVNGTPKAFPRSCEKLFALTRNDDLLDLEFNAVCATERYRMLEVPILSTKRHGGQSTTTVLSAVKLYWGAVQLWRARRRSAA
jgi:glycosyltransferase involved in cell wall biosynthesis